MSCPDLGLADLLIFASPLTLWGLLCLVRPVIGGLYDLATGWKETGDEQP